MGNTNLPNPSLIKDGTSIWFSLIKVSIPSLPQGMVFPDGLGFVLFKESRCTKFNVHGSNHANCPWRARQRPFSHDYSQPLSLKMESSICELCLIGAGLSSAQGMPR